ncbi:MAG: hypothetical protein JSU03_07460 [Bacteroidetes bacterium]|nr:hypothetical protein [Bacteroidota bacterium]MBS1757099.1 hypothetical protein [Bacteroidota bacterium]
MAVKYVRYKDIDKLKWDNCIDNAINRLLYGKAFYLDNLAENWDGLVLNDYEAVMPLTWKKKWNIKYLYQPSFIQQTGIFFTQKLSRPIFNEFISRLAENFKFAEIDLNYDNRFVLSSSAGQVKERTNYIIPLKKYKNGMTEFYHPNFIKSLRRLKKQNLNYQSGVDYNKVMLLYQQLYLSKIASVSKKEIAGFKKICKHLMLNNSLLIRQAYNAEGVLLAAVLLLKDANRLYNIISCITPDGKKVEANYFLYDCVINEFADKGYLLDLEGSDKKGIAAFYKKFNPDTENYFHFKLNNLPAMIKIFKR